MNDYLDIEIINFTDRCEGVVCRLEEKCVYNGVQGVRCVCRDNVDCPADLQPICGSDAKTYNNYCIMKATACREGKKVEKVADKSCSPGMSSFVLFFQGFLMLNRLSVAQANTSQIKTRLQVRFCFFVCLFVCFFRKKM